jgi:hypothetical protein
LSSCLFPSPLLFISCFFFLPFLECVCPSCFYSELALLSHWGDSPFSQHWSSHYIISSAHTTFWISQAILPPGMAISPIIVFPLLHSFIFSNTKIYCRFILIDWILCWILWSCPMSWCVVIETLECYNWKCTSACCLIPEQDTDRPGSGRGRAEPGTGLPDRFNWFPAVFGRVGSGRVRPPESESLVLFLSIPSHSELSVLWPRMS